MKPLSLTIEEKREKKKGNSKVRTYACPMIGLFVSGCHPLSRWDVPEPLVKMTEDWNLYLLVSTRYR